MSVTDELSHGAEAGAILEKNGKKFGVEAKKQRMGISFYMRSTVLRNSCYG